MTLRACIGRWKQGMCHPVRTVRRLWYRLQQRRLGDRDILCRRGDFALSLRSNSVLAEPLYVGGGFEEGEMRLIRSLARPGMRVLDIGANIGLYSVILGKSVGPSGRVWSFEPHPPTASYLRRNIEMNGLGNVTVVEQAVCEKAGTAEFHVFAEGCDVYNSLGAKSRPQEQLQAQSVISVPTTSLDDFCRKADITQVDLVKLDVEGAEERVLTGAEAILAASPNVIVVAEIYEASAAQCGCSSARLIRRMIQWGFEALAIDDRGGLTPIDSPETFNGYAMFRRNGHRGGPGGSDLQKVPA
jgi:FkbM family methyltransferase